MRGWQKAVHLIVVYWAIFWVVMLYPVVARIIKHIFRRRSNS